MKSYSDQERIEIFKTLYPLFKREVYDRRDQILKVASLSSGFFLILIFVVSFIKISGLSLKPYFYPLISGVLFFETVICYHLYQHKSRHEQAKRMVIGLEEQMGFFEAGVLDPSKVFFPEKWKRRGLDPGFFFYPFVHMGLIFLFGFLLC
ncbi:MAG: hypothetical protein ACYDBV_01685 [Nitrospiria bacterium]